MAIPTQLLNNDWVAYNSRHDAKEMEHRKSGGEPHVQASIALKRVSLSLSHSLSLYIHMSMAKL